MNQEGYLPDVQVYNGENSSIITFVRCEKLQENTDLPESAEGWKHPFILLALDQVHTS